MSILFSQASLCRSLAPALVLCTWICVSGCGGSSDSATAEIEDVDASTPVEITDEERSSFRAPADSLLSSEHVAMFLKASLLQFDLIREYSASLHERVEKMEKRAEGGGAIAGLRNLMEAGKTMIEFGDVVGGSYIRAARTYGYNPSEMEWVRERFAETAAYFAFAPAAQQSRAELAAMRAELSQAQDTSGDYSQYLQSLAEAEQSMDMSASGAVAQNIDVLRQARPNVTDPMWAAVGFSSGTLGLVGLTGLNDPNDAEAQQKLDEFRNLFTDALENRTSAGMEAD